MDFVHPLIYPVRRPGHLLAEASQIPKLVAVVILVIVLTTMGWTEEQILALLAVLFPLALTSGEGA